MASTETRLETASSSTSASLSSSPSSSSSSSSTASSSSTFPHPQSPIAAKIIRSIPNASSPLRVDAEDSPDRSSTSASSFRETYSRVTGIYEDHSSSTNTEEDGEVKIGGKGISGPYVGPVTQVADVDNSAVPLQAPNPNLWNPENLERDYERLKHPEVLMQQPLLVEDMYLETGLVIFSLRDLVIGRNYQTENESDLIRHSDKKAELSYHGTKYTLDVPSQRRVDRLLQKFGRG